MKRLKELRQAKGMTQVELAKALNMNRQSISHYEGGFREPDYSTCMLIARYFNVSVDYLIGGENEPEGIPPEAAALKAKRDRLNDLFGRMTPEERELLLTIAEKIKK